MHRAASSELYRSQGKNGILERAGGNSSRFSSGIAQELSTGGPIKTFRTARHGRRGRAEARMEKMIMKYTALSIASLVAASMAVGCANKQAARTNAPISSGVTDVRPITPAPAPGMGPPIQPVQPVQPVVSDTSPVVQSPVAVASATPQITGGT